VSPLSNLLPQNNDGELPQAVSVYFHVAETFVCFLLELFYFIACSTTAVQHADKGDNKKGYNQRFETLPNGCTIFV